MEAKPRIDTALRVELRSNVTLGDTKYMILSENIGMSTTSITTRIFQNGEPVFSERKNYGSIADPMDPKLVHQLVTRHHAEAVKKVTSGATVQTQAGKDSKDYLEDVKVYLRRKNNRKALEVLKEAYNDYPDDPHILTSYGVLLAIVEKKFKEGIDACRRALELKRARMPHATEGLVEFYLNLTRAYMASGDRQRAVSVLYSGIKYDNDRGPLHNELVKMGVRRKPPIGFLPRNNPINKYVGILLYRKKE